MTCLLNATTCNRFLPLVHSVAFSRVRVNNGFYSNNRGKDQAHLFLILRILIAFTASTARRCPSAWVRNTREKPPHRRSQNWCCALEYFFVRFVGSQIFIKVTLSSRITSHLQSIFLKLIHFPLITHLSGQSHVI